MPMPLSRIEREYVLKTLEEAKPPFSVLSGPRFIQIPADEWSCAGERFELFGEALSALGGEHRSPLRFCFFHKRRGIFFDLARETFLNGNAFFTLPEKVYLEEIAAGTESPASVSCRYGGRLTDAVSVSAFPLDCVIPDPELLQEKKNVLDKISKKSGIRDGSSSAVYRLFEYLDSFSIPESASSTTINSFIFIDDRFALASFGNTVQSEGEALQAHKPVNLAIELGRRSMDVNASISGIIPVRDGLSVYCFSLKDLKEEDKRFLFERIYRQKYQ